MKLCEVVPARLAAAATRAFNSSGKRIVVVDITASSFYSFEAAARVAQLCYARQAGIRHAPADTFQACG
jgi:hypothetical protein